MKLIPLLLAASLSACAITPSTRAQAVLDADASTVQGCRFLGTVTGSSGWGGLAASAGISNSRAEARDKAAIQGANRIVWNNISGGMAPYASGNAYLCH